jgi:hypothetical protein
MVKRVGRGEKESTLKPGKGEITLEVKGRESEFEVCLSDRVTCTPPERWKRQEGGGRDVVEGKRCRVGLKEPTSPRIVTSKEHSKHTGMRPTVLSIYS